MDYLGGVPQWFEISYNGEDCTLESQKSSTVDIKTHNQTLKNPFPKVLRSNDQINLVCSPDVSNENKQIGLRIRIEVVVGIGIPSQRT